MGSRKLGSNIGKPGAQEGGGCSKLERLKMVRGTEKGTGKGWRREKDRETLYGERERRAGWEKMKWGRTR